jgi:hypothetical protein
MPSAASSAMPPISAYGGAVFRSDERFQDMFGHDLDPSVSCNGQSVSRTGDGSRVRFSFGFVKMIEVRPPR